MTDDERRGVILSERAAGSSLDQIAANYSTCRTSIADFCKKNNLRLRDLNGRGIPASTFDADDGEFEDYDDEDEDYENDED